MENYFEAAPSNAEQININPVPAEVDVRQNISIVSTTTNTVSQSSLLSNNSNYVDYRAPLLKVSETENSGEHEVSFTVPQSFFTQPICIAPDTPLDSDVLNHKRNFTNSELRVSQNNCYFPSASNVKPSDVTDVSNETVSQNISSQSNEDVVQINEKTRRKRKSSAPLRVATSTLLDIKREPDEDDDVIVTAETIVSSRTCSSSQTSFLKTTPLFVTNTSSRPISVRVNATTGLLRPVVTVSNKFIKMATNIANSKNAVSPPFATLRELIGSEGRRAEVILQSSSQPTVSQNMYYIKNVSQQNVCLVGTRVIPITTWRPPQIISSISTLSNAKNHSVLALPSGLNSSIASSCTTTTTHSYNKQKNQRSVKSSTTVPSEAIIANTGISSDPQIDSVRSFVEGLNGLFSSYKPLAADVAKVSSVTLQEYKCNACGDVYLFESTLIDHLARETGIIEYDCTICSKPFTFYNRCRLLLHFSEDALRTGTSLSLCNYDHVQLKALIDVTDCDSYDNEDTQNISSVCPECNKLNDESLVHHFSNKSLSKEHLNKCFICNKCNRILPTHCAWSAHVRIHSKTAPYICPECGLQFSSHEWTDFRRHLQSTCFHFSLHVLLKCQTCNQMVSLEQSLSHLASHMTLYFKCSHCTVAFHSQTLLQEHRDLQHKGLTISNCKKIIKCQVCGIILQHAAQTELASHMYLHCKTSWNDCVCVAYVCPLCPDIQHCERKELLRHVKRVHVLTDFDCICEMCGKNFKSTNILFKHLLECKGFVLPSCSEPTIKKLETVGVLTVKSSPEQIIDQTHSEVSSEKLRCNKCQIVCKNIVVLAKHMKRHEVIASKKATFAVRKPVPFSGRQIPIPSPEPMYQCNSCKESFMEQLDLDNHMVENHGKSIVCPCLLCGIIYNSHAELLKHTKIVHEGAGVLRYSCPLCAESGKQVWKSTQAALSRHIIQGHKIKKNRANELAGQSQNTEKSSCSLQDSDTSNDVQTHPAKRLKYGDSSVFTCAVCEHVTESRGLFILHIATHRKSHDESVQCFECGLMFTILPALKRHLHVVHGISDFDKYSKETGYSLDDRRSAFSDHKGNRSVSSSDDNGPKECNVCHKVFDTETQLRFHMRTHGMAFIHSKRGISD